MASSKTCDKFEDFSIKHGEILDWNITITCHGYFSFFQSFSCSVAWPAKIIWNVSLIQLGTSITGGRYPNWTFPRCSFTMIHRRVPHYQLRSSTSCPFFLSKILWLSEVLVSNMVKSFTKWECQNLRERCLWQHHLLPWFQRLWSSLAPPVSGNPSWAHLIFQHGPGLDILSIKSIQHFGPGRNEQQWNHGVVGRKIILLRVSALFSINMYNISKNIYSYVVHIFVHSIWMIIEALVL